MGGQREMKKNNGRTKRKKGQWEDKREQRMMED
jgi:hypothetical protein